MLLFSTPLTIHALLTVLTSQILFGAIPGPVACVLLHAVLVRTTPKAS